MKKLIVEEMTIEALVTYVESVVLPKLKEGFLSGFDGDGSWTIKEEEV